MTDDLLYRDEVYRIIGACVAVHKDKGNGFAEPVYQDAVEIEIHSDKASARVRSELRVRPG